METPIPNKIPKGYRKLNSGEYPKVGDKEWNLRKDRYEWYTLKKGDELNYPITETEIVIRKV